MTTKTETTTGKVYLNYVEQWLDTLAAGESEEFREFAEVTPSIIEIWVCLLYTSPSPRDATLSRMPSSA